MARRRKQRGGDLAGNPASAWGWGVGTMGSGWQQFMNTMSLNNSPSNNLVLANKQQVGGRRSRRRSRRSRGSRRGGNFGAVLSQASAPLALLGMQQMYGKSRKRRRH